MAPRLGNRAFLVSFALILLAATGCIDVGSESGDAPAGCSVVQVATSPEKFDLLSRLAASYNKSKESKSASNGECAFVKVTRVSSGAGATSLADGWVDEESFGPKPAIWSPAASTWGGVVNQRLADKGQQAVVPRDFQSFMLTPLVIAMPRPMAEAIGWPQKPLGFDDVITLAQDPAGWGKFGHPEWGPFKLGKTNPNFSTSGLAATVAQYYTAVNKTNDLTLEDVNRPDVAEFNKKIESAVVHYGETTLTFLDSWYRNDQRGTALTYVSAVAVEEKSVIDYNRGNPNGILEQGEKPRPPRIPLVAIYPKGGTLFSDNPLFVLDAPWVNAEQKAGARAFIEYVQREDNQKDVLGDGFRPNNPNVELDDPIIAANGVEPQLRVTTLGAPDPPVLSRIITKWGEQRKGAQVLLVMDVSGSMGEPVADSDGQTRLDLAKQAAVVAMDQFGPTDSVGLWIFSTGISPKEPTDYLEVVPIGSITAVREQIKSKIRTLTPVRGTPLFTTTAASHAHVKKQLKPELINAVVLLTDGKNEDNRNNDLDALLGQLAADSEGGQNPVRVFTIGFGEDADQSVLKRIAETTDAKSYDSRNPKAIDQVFANVISNF